MYDQYFALLGIGGIIGYIISSVKYVRRLSREDWRHIDARAEIISLERAYESEMYKVHKYARQNKKLKKQVKP